MSEPLRKSFNFKFAPVSAAQSDGAFSGYASVFGGVDGYGDTIMKGAFEKSISDWRQRGRLPPLLWAHNPGDLPLGAWVEMREDDTGLYVRGRFSLDTQAGREAHALAKMGALSGLSIGYRPVKASANATGGQDLAEIELVEISIVSRPADDKARIAEVKALASQKENSKMEVEALRREVGAKINDLEGAVRDLAQRGTGGAAPPVKHFGKSLVALAKSGLNVDRAIRDAEAGGDLVLAKSLASGVGSAGGWMVPENLWGEFTAALFPQSVVRNLGARVITLNNGNATISGIGNSTQTFWVGEAQNIPAGQPSIRATTMLLKKLAALVPVTNDLLTYAAQGVEAFIQQDIIAAIASASDSAYLRGAGVPGTPTGLRNLCAPGNQIAATGGVPTVASVRNDLGRLELALLAANIPMAKPGWVMSPRTEVFLKNLTNANGVSVFPEMAEGNLRGYPFRRTTAIPSNLGTGADESEIILADFDSVLIADGNLRIERFEGGAYLDTAGILQSAVSRDELVIRAVVGTDIALRHPGAAAVLTGVTWSA